MPMVEVGHWVLSLCLLPERVRRLWVLVRGSEDIIAVFCKVRCHCKAKCVWSQFLTFVFTSHVLISIFCYRVKLYLFVSFCFYSLSFLPNTYSIPVLFLSLSYMLSGQFSLAVSQYCFSLTLERALLPDSGSDKDSGVPANFPLPTNVCSKAFSFLSLHHSLIVCVLFEGFYNSSILDFIYECDRNQGDFIVFIILMGTGGRGCVKDVEELVRETGSGPAL